MPTDTPSIATLAAGLIARHATEFHLDLTLEDCRIRLRSNSAKLIELLSAYYGGFARPFASADVEVTAIEAPPPDFDRRLTPKEPDPGKTRIKEEYLDLADGRVVRKRLTGMVFLFGGSIHLAIGPCEANSNQVINFINNRFIQWHLDRGCLLCHAAGVVVNGRGLALSGFAGAGKSTLALHLMSRGATFVSNDRLMVRCDGRSLRMWGLPKLPRINPGTILNNPDLRCLLSDEDRLRFEALPPEELWGLEHKYDAYLDRCFGAGRFVLSSNLSALVVLNWQRNNSATRIEPIDLKTRTDLLPAFTKSLGLFLRSSAPQSVPLPDAARYLSIFSNCPVYEVSGGINFPAVVRAFESSSQMP